MRARYLPPVVLNLIIINCIFFFCTFIFREKNFGFSMDNFFDLHYPGTTYFMPHQFITYGFMHADIFHLFFNMLAIIMFAPMIEIVWRPKRFLTFYILCILGSSVFTTGMYYFEIKQEQNRIETFKQMPGDNFYDTYIRENLTNTHLIDSDTLNKMGLTKEEKLATQVEYLNLSIEGVKHSKGLLGASGGVFGILIAFMFLYPEALMGMFFIPLQIKAKYFIPIMIALEFVYGVAKVPGDNISHYGHLGGALTGFIILLIWFKKSLFKRN